MPNKRCIGVSAETVEKIRKFSGISAGKLVEALVEMCEDNFELCKKYVYGGA